MLIYWKQPSHMILFVVQWFRYMRLSLIRIIISGLTSCRAIIQREREDIETRTSTIALHKSNFYLTKLNVFEHSLHHRTNLNDFAHESVIWLDATVFSYIRHLKSNLLLCHRRIERRYQSHTSIASLLKIKHNPSPVDPNKKIKIKMKNYPNFLSSKLTI